MLNSLDSMLLFLLLRDHYTDTYTSADGAFEGSYTMQQLLSSYPTAYFFLMNDDTNYNRHNVLRLSRIREMFAINNRDNMPCEKCKNKVSIEAEYCQCGYYNRYYNITKYLSKKLQKAALIKSYVQTGFWNDTEYMD